MMAWWFVSVAMVGAKKPRFVRVEAEDEWLAQNKASDALAAELPAVNKRRIERKQPLIKRYVECIDHAIREGEAVCGWGCCEMPTRITR